MLQCNTKVGCRIEIQRVLRTVSCRNLLNHLHASPHQPFLFPAIYLIFYMDSSGNPSGKIHPFGYFWVFLGFFDDVPHKKCV